MIFDALVGAIAKGDLAHNDIVDSAEMELV
jgi:hypothetical protein